MTDPTQFIVDQNYVHKVLTHDGVLGKGRDFLTKKECSLHLYTDKFKRTYVMQQFDSVDQEFVSGKLTHITKTTHSNFIPNITKLAFVCTRRNSKNLFDISIFYDATHLYGHSLQYVIKNKLKNKQKFQNEEILGFFWQIMDFLILCGTHTGEFLEITPVNIFCKPKGYQGYNFFPNNFGLSFEGTKWERNYHNPEDSFWKGNNNLEAAERAVLFTLGMVLLEMCSLLPPTDLYQNGIIHKKNLSKRIEGIKIINDPMICNIVKRLLELDESIRIRVRDIYEKQQYAKARKVDYFQNKAGFYKFKSFEGVCQFDKVHAIGEGLDENLHLHRGSFLNGILDGMCLNEENESTINIGLFEKGIFKEGVSIKKNSHISIGTKEKGIYLALNIGLLNKEEKKIIAFEGEFNEGKPFKGTVFYLNGDEQII